MSKNNEEDGCFVAISSVIFIVILIFIIGGFSDIGIASAFAILLTLISVVFIL